MNNSTLSHGSRDLDSRKFDFKSSLSLLLHCKKKRKMI